MKANKISKWGRILIFVVAFQIAFRWIMPVLSSWVRSIGLHGFPLFLTQIILPIVLVYETVGKFFIVQATKFPRFELTKVEDWPHVNLDALAYYTDELQKLGFSQLGDYTAPTIKGMMRLFSHPELAYFAEVGQIVGHQIFCSVSSELEENWVMATTNFEGTRAARATSHTFMRLPRKIARLIPNATPTVLVETLMDWRSQVTKDLSIQPLKDVSAEMYFARSQERFVKVQHRMLWSSLFLRQLEVYFYRLMPPKEWLGDYPKLKSRQANLARLDAKNA